jgi:hypothetical protein
MLVYLQWKNNNWTQIHASVDGNKTTLCGIIIPNRIVVLNGIKSPSCLRCWNSPMTRTKDFLKNQTARFLWLPPPAPQNS